MDSIHRNRFGAGVLATLLVLAMATPADLAARQDPAAACDELGRLLIGRAVAQTGYCAISIPRSDIELTLLGATMPADAVVSTITFVPAGGTTIVLGEFALSEAERTRQLRAIDAAGFVVTSLHRHMSGETPAIVFVHFEGAAADAREVAQRLRMVMGPPPRAAGIRGPAVVGEFGSVAGIPCVHLATTLGALESDVSPGPGYCAVAVATGNGIRIADVDVPPGAIAHRIRFRQTPARTSAVVTASLVLAEDAANGVLAGLVEGGFDIVEVGGERLQEVPRTVTVHAQANGNPLVLAETLRSALQR